MDSVDGAIEFSHTGPAMKIERGYAQHVGSRNEQQDAGLVLTNDGRTEQLVLVADGMGGHAGGSLASAQVAETARRIWEEHKRTAIEPKRLLERIVREGHESINRAGAERGLTPRSTCALLLVRDGSAHWAHVGDSRIYRLREGQLEQLTRDHSHVQELVDQGLLTPEEAHRHPLANVITRAVGSADDLQIDEVVYPLQAGDLFLLCSDGLNKTVPDEEITRLLAHSNHNCQEAVKAFIHLALMRDASDLVTTIVVNIDGDPAESADENPAVELEDPIPPDWYLQ